MLLREANIFLKNYSKIDVRGVLVYPSTYPVAVSTLSYHMLYYMTNIREEFAMEHTAYSFKDERGVLSIESGQPISKFDMIFYTVHYELDYARIISSMLESGIQPLRKLRSRGPIIVVGGPPVYANPSALSEIADVIVVGEMEGPIPRIVEKSVEIGVEDKDKLIEELGDIEGLYLPSIDVFTGRFYVRDYRLEGAFQPIEQIQPLEEEYYPVFGRSFLEETSRGCPYACRFCLIGYRFNPPRHKSGERILREVIAGLESNRVSKVTLISSSYFSNPDSKKVLEKLSELDVEASIPSLRLETLDLEALELMVKLGQKTLTIAPEAGRYAFRSKIGKPIPDSVILDVSSKAKKVGIKNLKLYFIYGFEDEELEDLKAIVELVKNVLSCSNFKSEGQVRVSINPFIPKAGTPLQWLRFEDVERLVEKWRFIKERLRGSRVRVEGLNPKLAKIQAVISMGGPEISRLLIEWASLGGNLAAWRRVEKRYGNLISKVLKPPLEPSKLPWAKFYSSEEMEILRKEYERYLGG